MTHHPKTVGNYSNVSKRRYLRNMRKMFTRCSEHEVFEQELLICKIIRKSYEIDVDNGILNNGANRRGDFQSLAWNCRRPQRNFVEMTHCVISWENWQLAAVQSDENEWVQICTVRLGSLQTKKNKGRNFDVVMWDRVDILNFSKLLFKNVVSLKKVSLDRETKERYFKNLLYFEHDKQMMKNWRLPMTPS